ncbi:MAG: GDP-mannose 4,6-dehydratase [Candidatus Wildermuthbacteria bacterium]|nr:GDP-mannose 4,6-dehydratase [Candidatus Wildermuthbacteria bacterium]
MKKKVLITGGLGFIFSHVTEYFVRQGYEVTVIDNCSVGSHPEIVDGSFKLLREDFAQPSGWKLVLDEKPDWFIHAASITDVDHSITHSEEVMFNNLMCNLNAFEAARQCQGLEKFLYVSTDEVYGECEHPKQETEILFPRNPYSCSKAIGSLMRYAYDNTYSTLSKKTAEIRMCNIFGPRQDTRKIFPQIIKSIQEGYSIPLQNGGEGYREYLYVKNVPSMVELIMQKGWRTYNVTRNDGFTVLELIRKVEDLTGKKVSCHKTERQGHDRFYRMDNSRIVKELGWKPLHSFEEGLKEYIGQALSHPTLS